MSTSSTTPLTTCPPIPDYSTLRKQNLAQIEKYYNELLKDYSGYASNNMASAQNMLANYHNQLNAAAEALLNNLNTTIDLVADQHTTIQENTSLVQQNRNRLAQLKSDIKKLSNETDAREQNAKDTRKSTKYTGYWHKGFLAINVILLLAAIGILIWIFLTPSSNNVTNYGESRNNNAKNTTKTGNNSKNNAKKTFNFANNLD